MVRIGAPGSAQRAHGIVKPDRAPASKPPPSVPSGAGPEGTTGGVSEEPRPSDTPPATNDTPPPSKGSQKGSQRSQQPAKNVAPTVVTVGGGGNGAVSSGAGFLLGLVFWGWVALPFLKDGPTGVKNMLKAKFLNKAPDGSWLP